MALSYNSVQKAYEVFNTLKKEFGAPHSLPAWPQDVQKMTDREKSEIEIGTIYGFDKKADDGWENLFFVLKDVPAGFEKRFKELAKSVPNSMWIDHYPYSEFNNTLFTFGWF